MRRRETARPTMGSRAARGLGIVFLFLVMVPPGQGAGTGRIDLRTSPGSSTLTGGGENELFGSDLTRGDYNGDGQDDFAFSACGWGGSIGATYVDLGPIEQEDIGIEEAADFTVIGSFDDGLACRLASGDVNGDGLTDLVIGAGSADNNQRAQSGSVYVVFGSPNPTDVDLADFDDNIQGEAGFRIDGPDDLSLAGEELDVAGDVNGDGLDDIVVGAVFSGTYIVFGQDHSVPVDLRSFDLGVQGPRGYRITHRPPSRNALYSVAGLGDVNGDGTPDIGIGLIPSNRLRARGKAYVAFGKATTDSQSVNDPDLGFVIGTDRMGRRTGESIDGVGDMNGDGRREVIVGEPDLYSEKRHGGAYVVFGKTSGAEVLVEDLGLRGFSISNASMGHAGIGVAGLGDVNGDGKPDVAIGDPSASPRGRGGAGIVYVVYGKAHNGRVDLSVLGTKGLRIDGAYGIRPPASGDAIGKSMEDAGDVDGNGMSDILLGSPTYGRLDRGAVYWLRVPR